MRSTLFSNYRSAFSMQSLWRIKLVGLGRDALMNGTVRVRFVDGTEKTYVAGTPLLTIAMERQEYYQTSIMAARVNNSLSDLQSRQETDAAVDFFDLCSNQGAKVYERSLTFVLIIAAERLQPGKDIIVEHSMGGGVYFEWILDRAVTEVDIRLLEQEMENII